MHMLSMRCFCINVQHATLARNTQHATYNGILTSCTHAPRYHFSAISAAATYDDIIGVLQHSTDCGETWTPPTIIWPQHGVEHQVVVTVIKNRGGGVMVPCDHWGTQPFVYRGDQTVVQHAPITQLYNQSAWHVESPATKAYTNTGAHHGSIVELRNGSFIAVGRGHDIAGGGSCELQGMCCGLHVCVCVCVFP